MSDRGFDRRRPGQESTSVYLLSLRHPGPVAKQVATLEHLSEGRFISGVGVGGEQGGVRVASELVLLGKAHP
jgi:alkanesulfonate monooxygenase SsuD/methylene tetrahydromethanopterin reductase-like flavin-dependent oxidoreductase (luciferase family)